MIRLGDATVEFNKNFKFFLTTKLPNPHYAPEVCVQVTLLNFMVTPEGLEDQMLGILVAKEEPETERKRQNLVVESAQSKAQLKEIEERVVEQEKTQALISETRQNYLPVAIRSSALFFTVSELCVVEPMYQYSLEYFFSIYLLAIATAEKFERNLQKRLQALGNRFVQLIYQKICDSLFEKDKLMFSMLLCFKLMEVDKELDAEEKQLLLLAGGGGVAEKPKPKNTEWLSETSWNRVTE